MLTRIVRDKKRELIETKLQTPFSELLNKIQDLEPAPSFAKAITQPNINIIAEIKYRSPSHGFFTCHLPPQEVAKIYAENGAAAISILTEKNYFGGNLEFLRTCRDQVPLLRKDFIFDNYQILESRIHGASAYLLIAAILSRAELADLILYGRDAGLDPLVEVHNPFELEAAIESGAKIIGVNNRNLNTFEVSIKTSFDIAKRLEGETGFVLVSESGIDEFAQVRELKDAGFSAFLIGSSLMEAENPGETLRAFRGTN